MALDPQFRDAMRRTALASRGVSRRRLLQGMGLGALALGAPGLAACGTEGAQQSAADCVSKDLSGSEKVVNWSNWPLYIDQARQQGSKVYPTLAAFEEQSGLTVNYTTDVNDNAEFFGVVRNQLGSCEATGRDLFVLTDYMAARMVDLGWIQTLDKANLPNVDANLVDNLRSPSWDPERTHSVPWQSGLTGIAYNSRLTKEVRSFDELLTRADLKGKVTLLSEMQDTMIFMLLLEGADPEDFSDDEFSAGVERLQQAVDSGQIRAFTGNEYAQDLAKGNILACEAWSGDVIQLQFENPDIKFVAPEEGLSLWSDNFLVPNKATHKANAEELMNYYYEPEVAAEVAAWVNYICPVKGAREAMTKIDKSLADNELIFPGDDLLANSYDFMTLDQKKEQQYQQEFAAVIGG